MVDYVGGQAVLEGVMMKYKDKIATAVRDEKGEIQMKHDRLKWSESKIPFLRGIINLFIVLYIGIKTLNFSSDVALGKHESKKGSSSFSMVFSLVLALVFAVFLFKFLPLGTATFLDNKFGLSPIVFNIVDGLVRFLIFIGYILLISQMSDIKRVFQYHGAEHKAVNCYEAGKEMTVENVQSFTTIHKRCGTTFVFLVLLISILVYIFIPTTLSFSAKLGLRLLLLPVIASFSYEILRLGAKYNFIRPLIVPGMLVQRLTTREPDDDQVEVAIKALKAVV